MRGIDAPTAAAMFAATTAATTPLTAAAVARAVSLVRVELGLGLRQSALETDTTLPAGQAAHASKGDVSHKPESNLIMGTD